MKKPSKLLDKFGDLFFDRLLWPFCVLLVLLALAFVVYVWHVWQP
jgi:TRAP-type mannitol/chloroaromatic compound transport system permease small subunit